MCYGKTIHQCERHRVDHQSDLCGCYGQGGDIRPCLWLKDEKIEWLEAYLDDLQGEVNFIKVFITTLKINEEGMINENPDLAYA